LPFYLQHKNQISLLHGYNPTSYSLGTSKFDPVLN
jgi:hypothetical protein